MRNWLYITIIIFLTAGVVIVWETPPDLLLPDDEPEESQAQLFSVVTQAQAHHFGGEGELGYTFDAVELRHYRYDVERLSDADFTLVTEPEMTFYTEDPPWHMRAAAGKLTDQGLTLTLSDNVRIWQIDPARPSSLLSELTTEQLTVRPTEKKARTNAPVTINTPSGSISAVGMEADLRNQRIEFLSEVQGIYEAM